MSFEHHQKRFYVQTERVELLIEIADQIAPNSAKVPPTFKDKIFYSPEHDGFCNKNLEHKHSIEEVIAHIAKKYLEFSKRD
jgi:hypothetical protein